MNLKIASFYYRCQSSYHRQYITFVLTETLNNYSGLFDYSFLKRSHHGNAQTT